MYRLLKIFNFNLILRRKLLRIYIPAFLFLFLVWLTTKITSISAYELVADVNEIGNLAPHAGIVSNVGILLLSATVSICLFSGYIINVDDRFDYKWQKFILTSGYFVLLLLIDDLFQLHENLSTLLFGAETNISLDNRNLQNLLELIVFSFYGLLFSSYIWYFRKIIYTSDCLLLIATIAFFAMSTIVDMLPETMLGHYILEEGFKFLGIVSLMTYYTLICYQRLKLNNS